VATLGLGVAARGALEDWVQYIEGNGRFEVIFFRHVVLPAGDVAARRPPKESREALNVLIARSPSDADLYLMRARVDEQQLDFTAAESDWQKRAALAPDRADGQLELADFYHRRLKPNEEIKTLAVAAEAPFPTSERIVPAEQQRSWRAFERIFSVIRAQTLPSSLSVAHYRAWIARYPKEASVYSRFFAFLLDEKQFADAEGLIGTYARAFPDDRVFPVQARASLEYRRGSTQQALDLYDRSFQPLWPPELVANYFSLLKETHHLRDFLEQARAAVKAGPEDVSRASRVFYYYQQQGDLAEAQRALVEYRLRMESRKAQWNSQQLWTLGQLFEGVHSYDEAARCYYGLYSLTGADGAAREKALAGIINLLLSAPEVQMRVGSEDFSFLRDIGTLDPYPGFLNGILSLLLNSQRPAQEYAQQEGASVSYFHRAQAAELLPVLDAKFPNAPERSELHSKLLDAYAIYGASDAVIRDARQFMNAFPKASQRLHVAELMADALARKDRVQEELAVYDMLLEELAAQADHVPLGSALDGQNATGTVRQGQEFPEGAEEETEQAGDMEGEEGREAGPRGPPVAVPKAGAHRVQAGPRSPEYSRVLERYISRLVELKRPTQVLPLMRREIDRNPGDPGIYERLATFLDQNRMGEELVQAYRRAIQQFPDRTWYHKLARWYLRQKQFGEFDRLTQEVIRVFSGTDLERYFKEAGVGSVDSSLYVQLNLYAHNRFPHDMAFVRNLLGAYRRREIHNVAAWEALIRQYWYYDDEVRSQFFEYLSSARRLDSELQGIQTTIPGASGGRWQEVANTHPPAAQFVAEAELWRCHYEEAAPVLSAIASVYPADESVARRASSVYRSLAAFDPKDFDTSVGIEENLSRFQPGDRATLTRIGEIYADHEMLSRSRPYWNRIAEIEPGDSAGYLESATVFWDYYLFDDALRLIDQGRKKLSKPALFAYEAGAIYENKRNYSRAVDEYVKGAMADEGQSPARARLLDLARQPQYRSLVEQATSKEVAAASPELAAVTLRVAVLETMARRRDLETLLVALTEGATSLERLDQIDPIAEKHGFDTLRGRLLERRVAMTSDPVERLRFRLALAKFQESKGDLAGARSTMESVYADNPTLLGVIRATADFYWRNKMSDPAIDTLLRAANAAYPSLKRQFTFEAARKATEAKEYARARDLLAPLVRESPYDSEYLAAVADTYAREGDDRALRDFYFAKIQALRDAPLAPDDRTERTATVRRGLILAFTRLKDFAGAVSQYVEIINRYPEDQGLTQEAAAYAERYDRRKQLLDYYTKATVDSPKDFRWPMALARVQTHFEDYPAAIASYSKARQVRPDRSDLLAARAALEERLLRFDEAVQSYSQLYELTYHNPQWMEKVAEIRARQGQTDAAVVALKKALIEGRPERPGIFFEAARQLESWNLLPQAREFAEHGVDLAGNDLLIDVSNREGARTYARVMAKLRQHEMAYTRLFTAGRTAGVGRSEANLQTALQEIGQIVRSTFTPEETTSFQSFLAKQEADVPRGVLAQLLVPVAQTAGLSSLEARWREELMMAAAGHPEAQVHKSRLIQLQEQRMKFEELAGQLEAYARTLAPDQDRAGVLQQAAAEYRLAGNYTEELRVLATLFGQRTLGGQSLERYFELLLATDPQRFVAIAGEGQPSAVRDAAANFALASGNGRLTLEAIAAHGRDLAPIWTSAYTALSGLYYSDASPQVTAAYRAALGAGTIGERVGKPVDRDRQLAGDVWFYYGSRYGEYLAVTKQASSEDYLPAMLEATPGRSDAYFTLAEYYREGGEPDQALVDYGHALELNSRRGEARDRMAQILWKQGKHDDAIAQWKLALKAFSRQEDSSGAPPAFWNETRLTFENIGERKILPDVRDDADAVLRRYVRRNGSYRAGPLLQGAMAASGDPAAGVAWILDLARVAPDQEAFLSGIADTQWVPKLQQEAILRRGIEVSEKRVAQSNGAERTATEETLRRWQMRWLSYLVGTRQTERAKALANAFTEEARKALEHELAPLEIRIAAQAKALDATLDRFQQEPEKALLLEDLRTAASALQKDGDATSARRVLEFLYLREIERRNLTDANFLGLAEVRLEAGNLADAVSLLRRMTLISGEPFENLMSAADLLVRTGHPAEATEFLASRVKAVPWDADARLRLAKAEMAANRERDQALRSLASVVSSREAVYETRAAAALALGDGKGGTVNSGSSELDLLASGGAKDAASAQQPFFYHARVDVAERLSDPAVRIRLLLEALAINPDATSPRVSLFHSALDTEQYRLALSAMKPLLAPGALAYQSYASRRWLMQASREDEGEEDEGGETAQGGPSQFLSNTGLAAAQRASLARMIAVALEKLYRLGEARGYWRAALDLEPAEPQRVVIKKQLQRVTAELKRREQDALRRPFVNSELVQKYLVRPRLPETTGQSPRDSAGGGQGR